MASEQPQRACTQLAHGWLCFNAQILDQLPADVLAELERALPARRHLSSKGGDDDSHHRGHHSSKKCPKSKPCPKVSEVHIMPQANELDSAAIPWQA